MSGSPRAAVIAIAAVLACASTASCSRESAVAAVLWTDEPSMALYAEAFNAENGRFRVETVYKARLARDFVAAKAKPALIAGRGLRGSTVRPHLRSLDHLFSELRLNARDFYADLLTEGRIDGRQLLIPVSFNLPAVAFNEDAAAGFESGFFMDLNTVRTEGRAYNGPKGGSYSRMGFSPRLDPDFLFLYAGLEGAGFQQGKPLSFDSRRLAEAVRGIREWVAEANGSAAAEDEFSFRYIYDPSYRAAAAGRLLFAYVESDAFFGLPEQKRSGLDFRWIIHDGKVPAASAPVYLGISRKGRGRRAAEAFAAWFFDPDVQRRLLDDARELRLTETGFGVAGGFSSLREVNEKAYPALYPDLVGHMPPDGPFLVPDALPENWPALKRDVVQPFLEEECAKPPTAPLPTKEDLEARISVWLRENPEG